MTNKDAIKILQEQQAKFNDEYIDYGGVNEAYKLAIKALEERPQDEGLTSWEQVCRIAQSCGYNGAKVRGEEE